MNGSLKRVLGAAMFAATSLPAQTTTITHATVVDVANGALHPDRTILVEGNRIRSVGPTTSRTPARGQVIDARGMYVIPGLWDMHTHIYYGSSADLAESYILPLFVANGITGVRDMGSSLDDILRARSEIAAHRMTGPRMVVAGPMLDGPGARSKASMAITTPEVGRKAVDSLQSRGVDFIKVQSGIPHDAYLAIATEAKSRGIDFEGHVPDAVRASEAIAAGQRSFEHLIGIFEASTPDEVSLVTRRYGAGRDTAANKSLGALLERFDLAREASLLRELARKQVWQCPTLFWERGQWLVDVVDFTQDPDSAYIPRTWLARKFPSTRRSLLGSLDTEPLAVRQKFVGHELEIVKRLHLAGVPLLAGTDTPAGVDLTPGISLHLELQRFVAAGLTPLEALQTATINPARFLGKTSELGSVTVGRLADLVILRANPLADIGNTRSIAGVFTDGKYWSAAELDSLRARIREVAVAH